MVRRDVIVRLRSSADGFALPAALFLLMVIAATSSILMRNSVEQMNFVSGQEATHDTFYVSDGAIQDQIRRMAVQPEAWKTMATLSAEPLDYTTYQPSTYASTNGIPTCTGIECLRSMVPEGGGLLKNVGPYDGDGLDVDASFAVTDQLDPENLPDPDVTLNGVEGWVQVERLERVFDPTDGLGADLSTQGGGYGNAEVVRFRLSGYSFRDVKSRTGQSTVVAVIELPAS